MKAKITTPAPDLDAILLREVAAHRSTSGSVLDPTTTNGPHPMPVRTLPAAEDAAAATAAPEPQRAGYEALFLQPCTVRDRSALYVSATTKSHLTEVVRRLGWGGLSVTGYVENILRHHLTLFREEINRLHKEKNTCDIL